MRPTSPEPGPGSQDLADSAPRLAAEQAIEALEALLSRAHTAWPAMAAAWKARLRTLADDSRALEQRQVSFTQQKGNAEQDLKARRQLLRDGEAKLAGLQSDLEQQRQELQARAQAVEARERDNSEHQQALRAVEADLQQRSERIVSAERDMKAAAARFSTLKQSLRSMQADLGQSAEADSHRLEDLARESAAQLEATRLRAEGEALKAEQSRARALELESHSAALEAQLSDAQAAASAMAADLESQMKRLAQERDQLRTRLEQQEAQLRRAGLEIDWGTSAKRARK
jgi:chromosome segregation protein